MELSSGIFQIDTNGPSTRCNKVGTNKFQCDDHDGLMIECKKPHSEARFECISAKLLEPRGRGLEMTGEVPGRFDLETATYTFEGGTTTCDNYGSYYMCREK